ncbi:Uma2 family endonuclease [Stieleria sp. ICT_E10.1]|uniref:Uma2 family endonuclease n=1 Tax=Stieleria sedimenti TaxID=2976331 RepID=UPI0021807225|nr:Uma2 family endonuclease [Stieleria sedimenti]MCS7468846.1 Uma2 family endonuclease [Stieleria sedimenti]
MSTVPDPDASPSATPAVTDPLARKSPPTDSPSPHPPRNLSVTDRVADVLADLGGIAADRLYSGTAEPAGPDELLKAHRQGNVCELVDGYLVERAMGYRESLIAAVFIELLNQIVRTNKLGVVSGADGFFRLSPSLIRGPDVAFTSWDRLPDRKVPAEAYPAVIPDLVVEVVSAGNTRTEMTNKRRDYFARGVRLVWMVDPDQRSVAVWRSMTDYRVLDETQSLDGEDVIPGLSIPLAEVFEVLNGPDEAPPEGNEGSV